MPLATSLEMNASEKAIHRVVERWNVDLGQKHFSHLLTANSCHGSFVHDREL